MKILRIFLVLCVLGVIFLMIAAWFLFRTPGISSDSVLILPIQGEIQEYAPASSLSSIFGPEPLTMYGLTRALKAARDDDRIKGVVLRIHPFSMGFAKLQEIRELVVRLEASGKWTEAYVETMGEFTPGNGQYYLASGCGKITLNPLGDVNLIGLNAEVPFVRGLLDKLHIEPDFDHIKEYKTAMNFFTEKEFTEAHREMMESLLGDLFDQMAEDIAASRKMTLEEVVKIIDAGPYSAADALEKGLIDRTAYWDEMHESISERAGNSFEWVKLGSYLDHIREHGSKIAVIYGMGPIFVGESSTSPFDSSPTMGSESIARLFKRVRDDDSIKAVVFRVDSPGGSAVGSEIIRRSIILTKDKKPVVVSMSDVAGSGGYWVSMSADKILADAGTITGSIGVVVGKFNTRKFWGDFLGITHDEVRIGKNANLYSGLDSFTEEQKKVRTRFMETIYEMFVTQVADERGLTKERVNEIGRGRVWTGKQGLNLQLVDGIGGLEAAVEQAKELCGIAADESVKLIPYPRKKSLMEVLSHQDNTLKVWMEHMKQGEIIYGPVWCPVSFTIH